MGGKTYYLYEVGGGCVRSGDNIGTLIGTLYGLLANGIYQDGSDFEVFSFPVAEVVTTRFAGVKEVHIKLHDDVFSVYMQPDDAKLTDTARSRGNLLPDGGNWLSVAEASKFSGYTNGYIYNLVWRRDVSFKKGAIGSRNRVSVSRASLLAYMVGVR